MNRRTYLSTAGVAAAAAASTVIAGCFENDGGGSDGESGAGNGGAMNDDSEGGESAGGGPAQPTVEDPPDAVYRPTHRESMRVLDLIDAGAYTLTPMLSYPHRFWIVTGGVIEVVEPDASGVHLMFALRDAETGVVLPVDAGTELRVYRDGERVGSPRSPWTMLSQEMGPHFGDNLSLDGDGTYTVEVDIPPLSVETTGALAGRFTESASAEFAFAYDDDLRRSVVDGVEYLPEAEWGEPGALALMTHDDHGVGDGSDRDTEEGGEGSSGRPTPSPALAGAEDYPGTLLGEPESGDAVFVTALLEPGSRFVDGEERYLLVSPRTPYNRVPLADTALDATVERDGEAVSEVELVQRIDGEYGLHYGAALDDVEPGDALTLSVTSIPQVARHQGYETAFVEMPSMGLRVPADGASGDASAHLQPDGDGGEGS